MIKYKSIRFGFKIKFGVGLGIALGSVISGENANAAVALENGNFFMQYVDHHYSGGLEMEVRRVHNSKAIFKGMFGHGWGSKYEVYVTYSVDGSVIVHEYGGGADNRFISKNFQADDLKKAAQVIIEAAKKEKRITTAAQIKEYQDHLTSDATFLDDEYQRFVSLNLITPKRPPVNSKLYSSRFNAQVVTITDKGCTLVTDAGLIEEFNLEGRLVKISDYNGHFISFKNQGRHITQIEDERGRKLFFSYNEQGLVSKIEGSGAQAAKGERPKNKVSTYTYNADDELVASRDADGNEYRFKYTADKRHNLEEIFYSDKTSMKIGYYGPEKHENVKFVKERNGNTTTYEYEESK